MTARLPRLLAIIAAAGAAATLALSGGSQPAAGSSNPQQTKADELAAAPMVDRTAGGPSYTAGAAARGQADRTVDRLPLPAGGNFNGIRWEEGGVLTAAEIEGVLEYNAFCQWIRAARDDADPGTALGVLDDVPQWPAFRGTAEADLLSEAVAEARAGSGPVLDGVRRDCDASHGREAAYARERGLTPSS
ncbi:MAG: hypothetical protein QOF12_1820 [Solirubrobacteraceae bacterium]|jgi:hypothetical protein|nr:hypothetical protein [Solirubrobacteraceae bacterium]